MQGMRSVRSLAQTGSSGLVVEIECHMSNSLPNMVIVGQANRAVDEARERIRSAFASSNLQLPRKRITINLAPADVPKESSGFDLAIATAILQAGDQLNGRGLGNEPVLLGELGLDGTVRPIRGIIGKLLTGKANGLDTFVVPAGNLDQAVLVPDIKLIPVSSLLELFHIINETEAATVVDTALQADETPAAAALEADLTLDDVIGQELGKRAVEISAAGGHNLLLGGPPGTGKSMLAKVLPGLLPPMSRAEMLEVTHLHSLASHNFNRIVHERPFRSPHHSASNVAVVGGGASVRPGEMSLAHRGVLLFDELPEFNRITIEALRQPLESRAVTISRARESADYPAHFIFVATANPCPCGQYGTSKECRCLPHDVLRYRRKLSGPILDRIDLYADVHEIDNSRLLAERAGEHTAEAVRARILLAREAQKKRFGSTQKLNADMTNRELMRHAKLAPDAKDLLDRAAASFGLSARAYMRSVKVARTIADIGQSDAIETTHVAEALQYRPHAFTEN